MSKASTVPKIRLDINFTFIWDCICKKLSKICLWTKIVFFNGKSVNYYELSRSSIDKEIWRPSIVVVLRVVYSIIREYQQLTFGFQCLKCRTIAYGHMQHFVFFCL